MKFLLTFTLTLIWISCYTQISEDAAAVFKKAQQTNKPVLLVFSGSDWCQPCIRFKKEILNDPEFNKYAQENILLLNADFPQRRQLCEETIQQNNALAEKYNPQGAFPHLVLLNADQSIIASLPYTKQSAQVFIDQLKMSLEKPIKPLKEYKKRIPAMGSFFEFIIVDEYNREAKAWTTINHCIAEVKRIEILISEWIEDSQVSRINQNAGIKPVLVPPELYQLIERSIEIGNLTQGAFDISFQGLAELWRFDGTQSKPPDSTILADALQLIDYQKIQLLDSNHVYLPVKGMAIGFGGIGQGYAVDQVKKLLMSEEVGNFVINSSGDIFAYGLKADGEQWKIGIANPVNKEEIIRWLNVDNKAVVTSGNYEKYFEYKGIRYAHIIDPKTGWPTKGIISATVISPHTELADALATAIFVLGKDVGMDLIDQLPDAHCIIVDESQKVYYSKELKSK